MHNNNDIDIIINNLIYLKPVTIILYGSYGRDEGGRYIDHQGSIKPYNDYDILIILNQLISNDEILMIKNKLESQVRVRWVDVSQKTIKQLGKLKLSIFNYDLKYASKVIYGKKKILDSIPKIDASKLPLEEANILFKTRMWTFMGSLDGTALETGITGEDSRFFRNQMAKAVLSIVDVCLLQKGAYHSSYKERVRLYKKLYSDNKELCLLSDWALSEKLEPKAPHMDKHDVKKLYVKVHKNYIEEMLIVLSKRYHVKIDKPEKLILLWKYYPINFIKRIGYLFIKRTKTFEKQIMLEIVQLYLLFAFNKNCKKYQKIANNLLQKLDSSTRTNLSWHQARLQASRMRLE